MFKDPKQAKSFQPMVCILGQWDIPWAPARAAALRLLLAYAKGLRAPFKKGVLGFLFPTTAVDVRFRLCVTVYGESMAAAVVC